MVCVYVPAWKHTRLKELAEDRTLHPRRRAPTPTERMQDYNRKKAHIFNPDGAAGITNGGGRSGRSFEGGSERLGPGGSRGRSFAGPAGGKAVLRNRDEDRRDPDFQRDHSRHAPLQNAPCFARTPCLSWVVPLILTGKSLKKQKEG